MIKSESIKNIAGALVKFHSAVGKVKKSETNPFFKSKYADLSAILDVIDEPLQESELAYVQFPSGEYEMTTLLMHAESGEWIQDTFKMTPAKNDPQGQGSVITYQRRYALGAILGLNIDEDDDGNSGSNIKTSPNAKKDTATTPKQPTMTKVSKSPYQAAKSQIEAKEDTNELALLKEHIMQSVKLTEEQKLELADEVNAKILQVPFI